MDLDQKESSKEFSRNMETVSIKGEPQDTYDAHIKEEIDDNLELTHENLYMHSEEVLHMSHESIVKSKLQSSERYENYLPMKSNEESNEVTNKHHIKEEDICVNETLKSEDIKQEPFTNEFAPTECVYIKVEDTEYNVNRDTIKDDCSLNGSNFKLDGLNEDGIPSSCKGEKISVIFTEDYQQCYESRNLQMFIDSNHTGMKQYKCNICYKMISSKGNLQKHINNVHMKNKSNECKDCYKIFSGKSALEIHIERIHKGIKYECNECHSMISSKVTLLRHIERIHEGVIKRKVKQGQCNICHKMFSSEASVKRHIDSVHKEIKKFQCNICNNFFSSKSGVQLHNDLVHRGIKKYECNMCHKMFGTTGNLQKHIGRAHKGLKY